MKTPLPSALLFVASFLVPTLGCDSADCPAHTSAFKTNAPRSVIAQVDSGNAPVRELPTFRPGPARAPAPTAPAPRSAVPHPARRPLPAHLFM